MAVDSVQRIPGLQVHQSADARDERESPDRKKRDQKGNKDPKSAPPKESSPGPEEKGLAEIGQILDSAKTLELLCVKPSEPKTTRKHAFLEIQQRSAVKTLSANAPNKLNKSA